MRHYPLACRFVFGVSQNSVLRHPPISHEKLLLILFFHLAAGLDEAADGELQILLGMGRRDLGADPGLALGHHGIGEADGVNAQLVELLGHAGGLMLVIEHDGHAGMGAVDNIEAVVLQRLAVAHGDILQMIPEAGIPLQHLDALQRTGGNSRSQCIGEQVGTAALPQQIDDLLLAGGEAAGSAAQGLTEGAGDDIHPAHDTAVLRRAAAMLAHETGGVAVVHHHHGAVLVGQVAHALQVGNDAVHGEHAVSGDELDPCAGSIG